MSGRRDLQSWVSENFPDNPTPEWLDAAEALTRTALSAEVAERNFKYFGTRYSAVYCLLPIIIYSHPVDSEYAAAIILLISSAGDRPPGQ